MTTLVPRPTRLLRLGCVGVLCGMAGLGFAPVFGGAPGPARFLVAILVAAAAGTAIGLTAILWPGVRAASLGAGGAVAAAAVGLATAWPGAAVLHGPWRLLTGALPADAAGAELYTVAVAVGWTALASGLLAAFSRSPLPATVPPIGCLIAGLALSGSAQPLPGWYLPVTLGVAVVLVAARRPVAIVGIVPILALAVLAGTVVTPSAPGVGWRDPFDARTMFAPPVLPLQNDNPIQQYLAYRNGTIPLELAVTTSHPVDRLRLVTFTEFDGEVWQPGADYRRAGTTLPPGSASTQTSTTVSQRVELRTGSLGWLPAAGRATRISIPGLGVDEATGDLVVPAGNGAPQIYEATSLVLRPRPDDLATAAPTTVADRPPYRLPRATQLFLNTVIRDSSPGVGQLLALWRQLARSGHFAYDVGADAFGGNSLHGIERMFAVEPRRGTSEQYASAFAVLAREIGYDARVVLGLRCPTGGVTSFTLTGKDIAVWTEVRFEGLGWVEFDPSPWSNPIGTPANPEAAGPNNPVDDPVDQAADESESEPPPVGGESTADKPSPQSLEWTVFVAALVLGGALVLLCAVPVTKAARRRRRRRAGTTRAAVIGAWREVVDRLGEAGIVIRPPHTTRDVISMAHSSPATGDIGTALLSLGVLVDYAHYGPQPMTPDQRHAAWSAADNILGTLRESRSRIQRLAMLVNPRPLMTTAREPSPKVHAGAGRPVDRRQGSA